MNIEVLKNHHLDLAKLFSELQETMKYEECIYDLREINKQDKIFALFHIQSGKMLISGRMERIEAFINLRTIDKTKIYGRI